jgi:hypothetical protein
MANVTGKILDPRGNGVQGATVIVLDSAGNEVSRANTAVGGDYQIVNLSDGNYKLSVNMAGFGGPQLTDVTVASNRNVTNFDITLPLLEPSLRSPLPPTQTRIRMTEDEYCEFLQGLAVQYCVSKDLIDSAKIMELQTAMSEMGSIARLARLLAARPERTHMDQALIAACKSLHQDYAFMHGTISDIGILDALDAHAGLAITNVKRSSIPDEDLEHIRLSGIDEPEQFLRYLITVATHLGLGDRTAHSVVAEGERLFTGPTLVQPLPQQDRRKRKKVIMGIAHILGGAVAAAGNTLIAAGVTAVAGPIGAAAIASAAPAVVWIGTGVGELRGE